MTTRSEIRKMRREFERWYSVHRTALGAHGQYAGDRILLDLNAILLNRGPPHPVFVRGLQQDIAALNAARGEATRKEG